MSGTLNDFDPDAHFWGWEALPALDRAALSVGGVLMGGSVGVVLTVAWWLVRVVV